MNPMNERSSIVVEEYIVRLSRGRKYLRGYLFCLYSVVVRHAFSLWKGEGKSNLYFSIKNEDFRPIRKISAYTTLRKYCSCRSFAILLKSIAAPL